MASMGMEGDELFILSEDYEAAVEAYTQSLSGLEGGKDEERCALLLRRSAARLRAGDAKGALGDAEEAADLRPGEDRAYLRRGIALYELGRYKESLEVLQKAERLVKINANLKGAEGDAASGCSGLSRWIARAQLELRAQAGETEPVVELGGGASAPETSIEPPAASGVGKAAGAAPSKEAEGRPEEQQRFTWHQKGPKVMINVHMEGVDVENVSFAFLDREARLVVRERKDKGGAVLYKREWRLSQPVKKSECRCLVMEKKIMLKLIKSDAETLWDQLEADGQKGGGAGSSADGGVGVIGGPCVQQQQKGSAGVRVCGEDVTRGPPASRVFPSSSRTTRDWSQIERDIKEEEESEKLTGDAALNKLFQDIYSKADDDTRRAMQKSFVESNGTVLSTNWSEIGSKKVETQAPGGMEVKKYEI